MDLQKTIAVVTGGSKGIGKAIADALREAGVTVETCSFGDSAGASVDVRDTAQVDAFFASVIKRHGHIDILINNAGWIEGVGPLQDITDENFERCMRTNVDGVFHCMRAALRVMNKKGTGTLINIASKAGSRAHPGLSAYSASKFAVIGLTQAVAKELKDAQSAIRCLSVSPGGVGTDMREKLFGKEDRDAQQTPEQVAEIVLGILRDEISVPQGADVKISRGAVQEIVEMA